MEKNKLHYVVVTGIIIKEDKYLIAKRSEDESAFPGLWSVPGGKLTKEDYTKRPKDTSDHWYNVLEELLRREVKEEAGLEIKNIDYLLSLSYVRSDGHPTVIISLYCDYDSGEVQLSDEFEQYEWVQKQDLEDYEFVPGLREEIELVDKKIKENQKEDWQGKHDDTSKDSVRDGK